MEDFTKNAVENKDQGKSDFAGQNLGIAALITAIITFVLAVIPCVGIIAIIPGIIAIVLASVGLSQAGKKSAPRGVLLAGLIIGIVASLISFSQIFVAGKLARNADRKWPGDIQNIIQDVRQDVLKDLEDASVSIKIESNGDKVEINTGADRRDRIEKLEELESVPDEAKDVPQDTIRNPE